MVKVTMLKDSCHAEYGRLTQGKTYEVDEVTAKRWFNIGLASADLPGSPGITGPKGTVSEPDWSEVVPDENPPAEEPEQAEKKPVTKKKKGK